MKLMQIFAGFIVFSVLCFIILQSNPTLLTHGPAAAMQMNPIQNEFSKLLKLVHIQNQTIHQLEKLLFSTNKTKELSLLAEKLDKNVNTEIKALTFSRSELQPQDEYRKYYTSMERDCEQRYGMQLITKWKKNEEIWCSNKDPKDLSELTCYPLHQTHKKLDGRGSDLFCVATNFVIDFSKVHGEYSRGSKPSLGDQYLQFDSGSLTSSCSKTDKFKSRLFMPHNSLQMNSFQSDVKNIKYDKIVDTTTYLLARDEDCENAFHSTADFMNMFLIGNALDTDFSDIQVMLFDKHYDGPYHELIQKAYSTNHPVLRHDYYQKKRVMFKKLIFHLESPAGLIFPKVSRPDPLRCYDTSLFDSYRRFVLQKFDLLDIKPPDIPTVTLSLRHRTPQKNVGRVLTNEEAVISVLKQGNMMNLNVVDTAKMSYYEQLKLIRGTNVLVGVHGAGLMFIMFAAEEAILVEIHPSYRQDRHFRHASRMTGKIYMPMRTTIRESCSGSSDSITVPIEEFRTTMDGALRIARNFDDGLSECGLICPPEILALDSRLNSFYKNGERRSQPINTNFPCG
eukprot:gene5446-7539_t